ncbi:MAG: heme a synthase [Frankiaceae bacterium]|nr:heme a synthase [Frankiaceae bacterium]
MEAMPRIPLPLFRRLTRAAVVLLALIVVSGGAVRLTGSGLGCPTWPQCGDGSFVTRAEFAHHGLIEFGNRVVTLVVGLVVLALPLLALLLEKVDTARGRRRRSDLVLLSFGLWVGYLGQAVLGGLTVLFHLHPALVAGHFLLSMLLLLDAVCLDVRARRDPSPHRAPRREMRLLATALSATAAVVLVVGTVVTGSGPHSGDSQDLRRFGFDVRSVSQLHADVAMLLTGLVIATVIAVRVAAVPAGARRSADWLALVVLGQVALGFTQYFLGIPAFLVGLHIAGATLVWIFALRLQLLLALPVPNPVEPVDVVGLQPQPTVQHNEPVASLQA